jgi:hypothetical protein
MSKSYGLDDINIQKYYIVTRPTRLSDLQLDDIDSDPASRGAVKRGRKLRERRISRIRNQLD